VAVLTVVMMLVLMLMLARLERLGSLNEPEMPVRKGVVVVVNTASVPMRCRRAGAAHAEIP
jgi:hypothetical protein